LLPVNTRHDVIHVSLERAFERISALGLVGIGMLSVVSVYLPGPNVSLTHRGTTARPRFAHDVLCAFLDFLVLGSGTIAYRASRPSLDDVDELFFRKSMMAIAAQARLGSQRAGRAGRTGIGLLRGIGLG
jgi:hypothetical protein